MSTTPINREAWKLKAEKEWRELAAKRAGQFFGRIIPSEHLLAWQGKLNGYWQPRFYAAAYLRGHGLPLRKIADVLGYDDHTSVMHARTRARQMWTAEHFEKLALADEQDVQGKKWRAA